MGCTKNSTRGIGTAANSGSVDNGEPAPRLRGLKAVMSRSSVQGLNDFPGSLHNSGNLLETSWHVHCQHYRKEPGVLMGQGSEVGSWTNLRTTKEQPETLSTARALALACCQVLWKGWKCFYSVSLGSTSRSFFFSKSYFYLHGEDCTWLSVWSISEPENE